jgi:O-antigen ligase
VNLLKWIIFLLFTECFLYKGTDFGPSVNVGVTVTPDRLVAVVIFALASWKFARGELAAGSLGAPGVWILLFAITCTLSSLVMGAGSTVLYRLFDFNYCPFAMFLIAKSMPHNEKSLRHLSLAFLGLGAYLSINGLFEYRGLEALVWPKYILDPHVGIQFGRTRGSFASSEALGEALTVSFLFYSLYTTWAKGLKLAASYFMMALTGVVIYATNQRTAWVSLGLCLLLLSVSKTKMRRPGAIFICVVVLVFFGGVSSHFSFWANATLFSRRQNTVDYRRVNDLTTLEMGKANPFFGVGFGKFKDEWPKYFTPIEGTGVRDLSDGNHNTFLGLFAETGLGGLIPYLVTFFYMFRAGLKVFKRGQGLESDFALVFLLVVTIYIFGAMVGDYRSGTFFNTVLFLLFGTVSAIEARLALAPQTFGKVRGIVQAQTRRRVAKPVLAYDDASGGRRLRDGLRVGRARR